MSDPAVIRTERLLVEKYFSKANRILNIGFVAGRNTIALYRLRYMKVQGLDRSDGR